MAFDKDLLNQELTTTNCEVLKEFAVNQSQRVLFVAKIKKEVSDTNASDSEIDED